MPWNPTVMHRRSGLKPPPLRSPAAGHLSLSAAPQSGGANIIRPNTPLTRCIFRSPSISLAR
ncbi:UNVERIFIED_CONTAM: hypothetical protein Slati_2857400 [Sesamum latifolium]|uniref:Uncharacterized protein n=1 Tax=Sesamum latifolium TaxID=2727402 RepID=A0AAW2VET0_9LAMI